MRDTETEDIHQPREHACLCGRCFTAYTWEWSGICLRCRLKDAELIP